MTTDVMTWGSSIPVRSVPLHIMVDIDDVLMPWAATVHEACRDAGLHDIPHYSSWSMWEDYGCTKDEWLYVVSSLVKADGLYHTPPYPGEVEALRELSWAGNKIHIVTARGFMDHAEQIRKWTDDWLEEWAVPQDSRHFAKDKVAVQDLLGVRFDFAIDDGLHNYEALDSDGVPVYLLTRPHNEAFPAERRVSTVREFADMIKVATS